MVFKLKALDGRIQFLHDAENVYAFSLPVIRV